VVTAIALSKATMANIKQNLVFAFGYNAIGIPVAAGVLYPFTGLLLSPMIAAAAMALSSLSVVGNANRLRTWHAQRAVTPKDSPTPAPVIVEVAPAQPKEVSTMVKDPVCGMEIQPGQAAAKMDHQGGTYYFCSAACHDTFMADPAKYAAA